MGGNSSKETQPHQARSDLTTVQQNKYTGVKCNTLKFSLRIEIGKWSTFKMIKIYYQGEYWRLLLPAPRSYIVQATSYSTLIQHMIYMIRD